MPKLSGIAFYKALNNPPKVIFCTAYDQYAIDAFELHAADYLLKPVSRARLNKSLEKIKAGIESDLAIESTVSSIVPKRFLGKRANRYHVVPVERVMYFWSEGGLTQMWTKERFYWMEPALNELIRLTRPGGKAVPK